MAEQSAQDKTEKPTERRLEDALEKGQVARSQDLNSVAVLLGGILAMKIFGEKAFVALSDFTTYIFTNLSTFKITVTSIPLQMLQITRFSILSFSLLLLMIFFSAILGNVVQDKFRIRFSKKALEPKFSALDPIKGFKKLFSLNSLVELIKGILKFTIVGFIVYKVMRNHYDNNHFWVMYNSTIGELLGFFGKVFLEIGYIVSAVLLILGIADYVFQKWQHEKKLRMTKQEIKDERKQYEGNPEIKGRIRSVQRQLSRSRMMTDVPDATVVVTNPTFIAIAIKYKPKEKSDAPIIVAKGKRKIAEKIKEIAIEHNIPIIEDKPLARSLFEYVEIGMQIPFLFFQAVAEILAKVYKMKKNKR